MRLVIGMFIVVSSLAIVTPAQDLTVSLPPGKTLLGDIGMFQVSYQSYGGDVVKMPVSWAGNFTEDSGIAYVPNRPRMGRNVIFMHSPWRVPPGKTWVDYRLRLPEVTPITLSFGIAMQEDVANPEKSDGVTFGCYVLDGARERELLHEHQATGIWKDFRFDLAPWAGKSITLRLQVEPGPANNASWDYSLFGDANIMCGTEEEGHADLLAKLTSTRAYKATAGVDERAVSNNAQNGVVPSNLLPAENAIRSAGDGYDFVYEGADCRIVYHYAPRTGTLDDFVVQVDDSAAFKPAASGGVTFAWKEGEQEKSALANGGEAVECALDAGGRSLRVVWQYPVQGQPLKVVWEFGILGKALTVSASSDDVRVSEFNLGSDGMAAFLKTFEVPYLQGYLRFLPAQNVYTCRYLDWTQSHASRCPAGQATYERKTDGARNALVEKGYIAVSPNVQEVLPNIPHPASPFLAQLGPRIMLDIWGHNKNTYAGDAENLRALKDNGVDRVAIIQHVWQRYGYDVKLPDHLPANPEFGGDEGMIEFGKAANECGYLWSLHENYIDLYPDAPSYDETAAVLCSDASKSKAWFNGGTGVQSYGLKCNRALGYAQQNAPEAHKRFKTTAAYLDVHTCVPPWHQLDHDATQPMAAMALLKVQKDAELFQFMRDTHEGPLFGEGYRHMYWAGQCDGVEAQVDGGENQAAFLDFDLLKIHPQMVNHGMGYYERWFTSGYNMNWGVDAGKPAQVDKYRAMEIAYGHAGFIGNAQTTNIQWIAKEHHLMHAVQRLYGTAKAVEIAYEIDGQFVPVGVALAVGERRRQRVKYDSGLTVWVNWKEEPWEVEGRVLPQWGFLALGPETEVCTVLKDGKFADYAECPEYLFVDARTVFNMPYVRAEKDIEPTLDGFEHLGGGRIRVSYKWVVNDTLDRDYTCFVHFTNPESKQGEGIAFQQDHGLAKPTGQWKPGDVIVDGPYEITVPADGADAYDIGVGFYKDTRVPLKGVQNAADRILIGRLVVERESGQVKRVTLGEIGDAKAKDAARRAEFAAHLNPAGTWVDFGKAASNGSVKVNRNADGLVVFPYPRDKVFTVCLDVKAIAPNVNVDLRKVRVTALAAGTQAEIGEAPHAIAADGRLQFDVGMRSAGRYRVTW